MSDKVKPVIEINESWCKGCYICIEVCPKKVVGQGNRMHSRGFLCVEVLHADKCTLCRNCELMCPDLAISVGLSPSREVT